MFWWLCVKCPSVFFSHHEFCSSKSRDIYVPLGYVYYFYTLHKIFIPPKRQAKSLTLPKNRKQLCPRLADKLQAMTSCQSFLLFWKWSWEWGRASKLKMIAGSDVESRPRGSSSLTQAPSFPWWRLSESSKVIETTCKSFTSTTENQSINIRH